MITEYGKWLHETAIELPPTVVLERALRFFERAPTGQYDETAAACIRVALEIRKWHATQT